MPRLAVLRWTTSIFSMFSFIQGLQTEEAYSTCGLTKELLASVFISLFFVLVFLFTQPRVLLTVLVSLLMCEFQLRSAPMFTPRYLAESTGSKSRPCMSYLDLIGLLDLEMWSTWHFLGLTPCPRFVPNTAESLGRTGVCYYHLNWIQSGTQWYHPRKASLRIGYCQEDRLCIKRKGSGPNTDPWE